MTRIQHAVCSLGLTRKNPTAAAAASDTSPPSAPPQPAPRSSITCPASAFMAVACLQKPAAGLGLLSCSGSGRSCFPPCFCPRLSGALVSWRGGCLWTIDWSVSLPLGRGCSSAFLSVVIRGPPVCGSELQAIKSTVPGVTLLPSTLGVGVGVG